MSQDIIKHCQNTFAGECTEVGMYLVMSRQADREGYPGIARVFEHYVYEEANHASRYAEKLGSSIICDTKADLEVRIVAEKAHAQRCLSLPRRQSRRALMPCTTASHEMARNEARHAASLIGLYNRYFK